MEKKAFQAIISGRVQGVGFRYFTLREALRLNLAGWVRNLPNGAVEVYAEGEEPRLRQFLAALNRGPSLAIVENVRVDWEIPLRGLEKFEINI